jgi:hypothetical protein
VCGYVCEVKKAWEVYSIPFISYYLENERGKWGKRRENKYSPSIHISPTEVLEK